MWKRNKKGRRGGFFSIAQEKLWFMLHTSPFFFFFFSSSCYWISITTTNIKYFTFSLLVWPPLLNSNMWKIFFLPHTSKFLGHFYRIHPVVWEFYFWDEESRAAQVAFEIKASFYAVVLQLVNVTTMLGTKKVNESQGYHLHKCKDALEA